MTKLGHLSRRFFGSLRARPLDPDDHEWVRRHLTVEELRVWETLGRADRAESVATAREFARLIGPDAEGEWVAAALCHDVGKADVALGAFGRAGATVIAAVISHGRARRMTNRIGRYIDHDEIGGARLAAAGARGPVAGWAGAHHRAERWAGSGIPVGICELLAAADGQ